MSIDKNYDKYRENYISAFNELKLPKETEKFLLELPQRSDNMKKLSGKRMVNVLACAVILILGVTCYAAVMASKTESQPVPASLSHSYSDLKDYQKQIGLTFPCPEEAGLGYTFFNMNINDDADYDEEGNVIGQYGSFYASYFSGDDAITYKVSPLNEYANQKLISDIESGAVEAQTDTKDNICFYYTVSEESYDDTTEGTETAENVNVMKLETVTWWDGSNFYQIYGYDQPLSIDEWFTLADSFTE